jgi:CubicO group peptidase (beta-lactamase class C family)
MNFSQLDHLLHDAVPGVAPALVCHVEQAGRVVFARGYGWINPMLKRQPVTTETLFDLSSLTQLFTTTACLRMADAGLLSLDQPVAELLPDFDGPRYIGPGEDPQTKEPIPVPEAWRGRQNPLHAGTVTLRQLLTHTGGLPGWRNLYTICGGLTERPAALHRAELLRRQRVGLAAISGFNFAYPPGESYLESDIGMILLGGALAACVGDPTLAETLRNWIFNPLNLSTQFNPPSVMVDHIAPTEFCALRNRRLHGEVHDENAAALGGIAGHAGLFGTAHDVARLAHLYLDKRGRMLHRATARAAIETQISVEAPGGHAAGAQSGSVLVKSPILRRGLGWKLPSEEPSQPLGPRSFGFTGFTGVSIWGDPDRELTITLLTNRIYHGRSAEGIVHLQPAVHAAVVAGLTAH